MGFKNTSSFVVILAAILLGVFYIRPALATIGELQDQIFVLKDNADKATEVNARLQEFQDEIASLRQSDIRALETYLPTDIDVLQVMHDVETIAEEAGLALVEVAAESKTEDSSTRPSDLDNLDLTPEEKATIESFSSVDHADISVTVSGEYAAFKRFIDQLARNNYPLEVVSLEFGTVNETTAAGTETTASYSFVIRTYAFNYLRNR